MNLAGVICRRSNSRGGPWRRLCGARSITAALPGILARWGWWIISGCQTSMVLVSQRIQTHSAAGMARNGRSGRAAADGRQNHVATRGRHGRRADHRHRRGRGRPGASRNCPPVTLAVESGPGEFPTGPSITFAPDSDIVIRDGHGGDGISFLFAGTTVIARTFIGGLPDATLTITVAGRAKICGGRKRRRCPASVCAVHRSGGRDQFAGEFWIWRIPRAPAASRPATARGWPTMAMRPRTGRLPRVKPIRGGEWIWNAW
jgi:hypothetical protein